MFIASPTRPPVEHALDNITRVAAGFIKAFSEKYPLLRTSSSDSLISPISVSTALPEPPSLLHRLDDLGVESDLANTLSRAYLQSAAELKRHAELAISRVCADLAAIPEIQHRPLPEFHHDLVDAVRRMYLQGLDSWIQECTLLLDRRTSQQTTKYISGVSIRRPHSSSRPTFNQEFIPFLEKYFEHNAYPSTADRSLMAQKSMMTPRQIEVWFQNHRRRSKLEGKPLKRLHSADMPKLTLESLEKDMPQYIIPEEERVDVDSDVSEYEWQYDSDEEDVSGYNPRYSQNHHLRDVLDVEAPPHAFPSPFPPTCSHNPFPPKEGPYAFPPPPWMRRPATSPIQRQAIDLDEFVASFSRLTVRDGPRKHWRKKVPQDPRKTDKPKRTSTPPPKPDRSAATLFITTRVPSAPHPAFVCPSISVRVTPPSPLPNATAVPAPPSRLHPFRSPSPQTQSATLFPTTPTPTAKSSRRRKVAPLPKRIPNGTSIAHRGVSPAMSDASPSPARSHSPPSRTPSFESVSTPQRRMSSDSGSSSSSVVTPESSPVALPHHIVEPSQARSLSGFAPDLRNFDDLFGDSPARSLSPVEGLQSGYPQATFGVVGGKQPFNFSFGKPPTKMNVARSQS